MNNVDYKQLMAAASTEIARLKQQLQMTEQTLQEPIAVIGMSCRFPGHSNSPEAYWELLRNGLDGIREITDQRGWRMDDFFDADPTRKGKISSRFQGLVDDVDLFDAEFFGIAPVEAERLDPQQRLLLEVAWEALESAACPPDSLVGTNTGIFLGISCSDYATLQLVSGGLEDMSAYDGTGNALSVAAGRLSYFLGLQGPCMAIDTACSSSLIAVSRAVQSLRARECDAALTGGASLIISPMNSIIFSTARMLSADGKCKTFDADANGYVRGEGVGLVYLKRLSDAQRDNDRILGLITGVASNQDGRSQGLTAPNEIAQEKVIQAALKNANLTPDKVTYIEAHGTGTPLGDPIEMQALAAAYCQQRNESNPLWVASSKTNLGHMETAAGIGGLIKVLLCLQHGELPPHLNFKTPNPHIPWANLPVKIPLKLEPWRGMSGDDGQPLRVGAVSSFGFGGSNAHVILQQAPIVKAPSLSHERRRHLFTLSARNEKALRALAQRYADVIPRQTASLGDLCFTANTGRAALDFRATLLVSDTTDLVKGLAALAEGTSIDSIGEVERSSIKLGWILNDSGTASAILAQELAAYRQGLLQVTQVLGYEPATALDQLFALDAQAPVRRFAHHWARATMWRALGVQPARMLGLGLAEIAVAALVDIMTLSDAIRLAQVSASASAQSADMKQTLAQLQLTPARTSVIASLSGESSRHVLSSAEYWLKQPMCQPDLDRAIESFQQAGITTLLLLGDATPSLQSCLNASNLVCIYESGSGESPLDTLLNSAGKLWVHGVNLQWRTLDDGYARSKIALPTYPFQRKRYWPKSLGTIKSQPAVVVTHATETANSPLAPTEKNDGHHWFHQVEWIEAALCSSDSTPACVVVCHDASHSLAPLISALEQHGTRVIEVLPATTFDADGDGIQFDYFDPQQWRTFWHHLKQSNIPVEHVIWGGAVAITGQSPDEHTSRPVLQPPLLLAQSIASAQLSRMPRIWLITRNALNNGNALDATTLVQSLLHGFGRVMAHEIHQAKVSIIDLTDDTSPAMIAAELGQSEFEDQISYRGTRRQVARVHTLPDSVQPTASLPLIDAAKTYLITGGLGALGLVFARWLVQQGARHLILAGRSVAGDQARQVIDDLRTQAADIRTVQADVSHQADVARLLQAVSPDYPLGGILHAAGVLDDGILANQDWNRFDKVLAPKALAAWWLHEATRDLPLDFFVLFSSIASTLGSPGQSNYAAANAYLDALAQMRQQMGLSATVINWGPWDGSGMAGSDAVKARLQKSSGITLIPEALGPALLATVLQSRRTQTLVASVDWNIAARMAGLMGNLPPLLKDLIANTDETKTSPAMSGDGELSRQLQQARPNEREKLAMHYLRERVQEIMGLEDRPDVRLPLQELGMDSLMAVELRNALSDAMGYDIPIATMFDYPTIQKMAAHLAGSLTETRSAETPAAPTTTGADVMQKVMAATKQSPPKPIAVTVTQPLPVPTAPRANAPEPIAVIGMACRFPGGANNPAEFWQVLIDGVDGIVELETKRWDQRRFFDPDPEAGGKMYVSRGGLIDNVDLFDADFFSISPREAVAMDPQQRLLLETSWSAIEAAGYTPDDFARYTPGVYVGIAPNDYSQQLYVHVDPKDISAHLGTGAHASMASGRLSYFLGFQGPCMTIDTACSSSLVAIHNASQALRAGECDAALAGGCNLTLSPLPNVTLCRAQMLAPDGHCKTFDASADGYVRSEGCGIVVLKRLSDAQRDGDHIIGLICGSAINQDGRSQGVTAPNGPAQEAVIGRALKNAQVAAADVDYVEAHGTGTQLGDPIEVLALNNTYGKAHSAESPLIVGAVKSNIGHLEAAAGVAGIMKTLMALRHRTIPANLNLRNISPYLQYDASRMGFADRTLPWPAHDRPRRAAVSSFGFSGSNAHAILQEAPATELPVNEVERPLHLLTLSGRTPEARQQLLERYQQFAPAPGTRFSDIAFTANVGRVHHGVRAALIASSIEDLRNKIAVALKGKTQIGVCLGNGRDPHIAFLFSGQGSQYAGMAQALYLHSLSFRREMDACRDAINPHLPLDLYDVMWGAHSGQLNQTQFTQPALFALEVALSNLLRSWGITPQTVMGHSVGEYAAAYNAGVFTLEEGARLITARGRLMQALPEGGAMCAVNAPAEVVESVLAEYPGSVSIAAFNTPTQTVISGAGALVKTIASLLTGQGFESTALDVSHAFHSPLMEPMLAEFAEVAASIRYQQPTLDVLSNLTGKPERARVSTPEYWVEHVIAPVRFMEGIQALSDQRDCVLLEIGPKPVLLGMARATLSQTVPMIPCLRAGQDDWRLLLHAVGELYCLGADLDWKAFEADYQRCRTPIPTYPFQGKRHWFEETGAGARAALGADFKAMPSLEFPLLGKRLTLPGSDEIRFESRYSEHSPAYLKDHKLFGTVVVPGASHLSLFLAAARQILGTPQLQLTDACFLQPLILPDGSERIVHTVLRRKGTDQWHGELMSIAADDDGNDASLWVSHATSFIEIVPKMSAATPAVDPVEVVANWEFGIGHDDFYRDFDAKGYNLGESFRWLDKGWKFTPTRTACWQMRWPGLPDVADAYALYPSLIDACFQAMAGCDDGSTVLNDDEIYIPFSVADLRLNRIPSTGEAFWVVTTLRQQDSADRSTNTVDIQLLDNANQLVAEFTGVEARLASRAALSSNLRKDLLNDTLYELHWKPQAVDTGTTMPAGEWLILSDQQGVGAALFQHLREQDVPARCVGAAEIADPLEVASLRTLLQQFYPEESGCAGIVFLWPLDATNENDRWEMAQALITGAAAALMSALAQLNWRQPPGLWLMTQLANTPFAAGAVNPQQTALWGLARTFAMEHSEFRPVRLDLDPQDPPATAAAQIMAELTSQGEREDQVMFRDGARYVARLTRSRPARPALAEGKALTVRVPMGGLLDKLLPTPTDRREPGANEVEIEVSATALNFRDVLNALGMFREYAERMGLSLSEFPLGFDCAGVVVRVGADVNDLRPGDAVVAGAYNALSTHVIAHQGWVHKKPAQLSFEQAAAIPTVFMTAWHALAALADIKPGERVLIHAAAGGVGQAALQVALHLGAEVYATASPGKWNYLLGQGVKSVFNSREADFADGLLAVTGGHGVDVVLNSFNGEFIAESLKALHAGGRFIEIGKIDVWSKEQMQAARPDVDYHIFDVAEGSRTQDVMTFAQAFGAVMEHYQQGHFKALPVQTFSLDQMVEGFRHLQSGRNVGKVVITMPEPVRESMPIRNDCSYLITGGLGSLGLRLADWLIQRGARHLVLTSRRSPAADVQQRIDAWRQAQISVDVACCDVGDPTQVEQLFHHLDADHPPLAGVIHAAGVLDDGMLLQQNWSRFKTVYAAKFAGWYLHQATQARRLDFFCCFSSLASLMGSPGQANYAAANGFLDGLVQYRRSLGLPAIGFNWGPWADGGMAASSAVELRFNTGSGVGYLSSERGLLAFERWLPRNGQFGVMAMDWPKVIQNMGLQQIPPLLAGVVKKTEAVADNELQQMAETLRQRLNQCDPSERQGLMIDFICDRIAALLGYDGGHVIDPRQPLQHLGLDSLMAVELRNLVNSMLGRSLPATLLFKYPSVDALTGYLVREIFPDHDTELAAELGTTKVPAHAPAAKDIDAIDVASLSDEEAAQLLSQTLAGLQETAS